MKKCSCGKIYLTIPCDAKKHDSEELAAPGYYYNCECKSTLFWPIKPITETQIIQVIEWGKRRVS